MATTLAVRNVPPALHARLKRRAEAHLRSLDDEGVVRLEKAVEQTSENERQAALERIKHRRQNGPVML